MGRIIGFLLIVGVVYLLFLILSGALTALGIFSLEIGYFFQDNWLVWVAIVLALLSAILFYASSKSYKDVKINESYLPNPKRIFKQTKKGEPFMSLIKKGKDETVEFDLSKLTMEALVKKMAYEMTKPGPIFFKGWSNDRLRLDVERVQILQSYIDSIRSTGESLMELQADAFLSYEKIKTLTEIKRTDLKRQLQQSKIELDFAQEEYAHRLKMMKLERESFEEDIKMKRAQREQIEMQNVIDKLKADADYKLSIAKSKKEKQIALILAEAVKYYKDLPNVLKSYVAVQLGSEQSQNPDSDMELQDKLKNIIVRKHKAEARKLEYGADENKALLEALNVKLTREKKKHTDNGNV